MWWTQVITVAGTLIAAFGTIWLTGDRADRNRRGDVRMAAYADLATAALAALDNSKHLWTQAATEQYDEKTAIRINQRTDELIADLHRAVAGVRLVGSGECITRAKAIEAAATGEISSHLMQDENPRPDFYPWRLTSHRPFKDDFENATDAFIETAQLEITPARSPWFRRTGR